MINPKGILYIEPSAVTSPQPLIDELTRKMTAAYRRSTVGTTWRGVHTCNCGVHSDNCEHKLSNGVQTNSLCIHYLAFHRDEISMVEIKKVRQLECGEEEPSARNLIPPSRTSKFFLVGFSFKYMLLFCNQT